MGIGIGARQGKEVGGLSSQECKALLLARQLQEVGARPHDGSAAGGHLENLLLLSFPCEHIELLLLQPSEQSSLGHKIGSGPPKGSANRLHVMRKLGIWRGSHIGGARGRTTLVTQATVSPYNLGHPFLTGFESRPNEQPCSKHRFLCAAETLCVSLNHLGELNSSSPLVHMRCGKKYRIYDRHTSEYNGRRAEGGGTFSHNKKYALCGEPQ